MSVRMPMLRFGQFEIDVDAGALHRRGERVHLPPQAFKVLALLVRQGGGIVTRAEIREQLWGTGTHVEFDQGLNFCVRQVREALGDHANSPQYIETLPRRGYRLLTPVASSAVEAPAKLTRLIVLPFRVLRPDPATDFLAYSLPDDHFVAVGARIADRAFQPGRVAICGGTGSRNTGGRRMRSSSRMVQRYCR